MPSDRAVDLGAVARYAGAVPMRAPHQCNYPGCRTLVRGAGKCERHAAQVEREDVARRGTTAQRGYDRAWAKLAGRYRAAHPYCELHLERGERVVAVLVDHRIPHRGDEALRMSETNLMALCRSCHATKTASEGVGYVAADKMRAKRAGGIRISTSEGPDTGESPRARNGHGEDPASGGGHA